MRVISKIIIKKHGIGVMLLNGREAGV